MWGARNGTDWRIRAPAPGCCLMMSNSAGVSAVGLEQHRVGHADLADVVQQRAQPDHFDFLVAQAQRPADRDRQHADALGMSGRVRVARVERHRERANRAGVGGLRLIFGGGDRRDERVERVGQHVDLEARAGRRPAGSPTSREAAMRFSDVDSWPIGSVIIRASQKLADEREQRRAAGDERQALDGRSRRGARRFVDRRQRVEAGAVHVRSGGGTRATRRRA